MPRKLHDWVLVLIATGVFLLLSLPEHWSFDYWAESPALWVLYVLLGALLSLYVLWIFIRSLRSLFEHEEHHDDAQGEIHE